MIGIHLSIQHIYTRHAAHCGHNRIDFRGIAPFGKIGHALNQSFQSFWLFVRPSGQLFGSFGFLCGRVGRSYTNAGLFGLLGAPGLGQPELAFARAYLTLVPACGTFAQPRCPWHGFQWPLRPDHRLHVRGQRLVDHLRRRLDRLPGLFSRARTRSLFPIAPQLPGKPREASRPQPRNDCIVAAQAPCFSQDRNGHADAHHKA